MALDALMVVTNPRRRMFSPAQRRAQALFVKRVRNGSFRRNASGDSSVRSPTSTSTEVRSPTSTSTKAHTSGNVTVTGGAGRGATTRVTITSPRRKNPKLSKDAAWPSYGYKDKAWRGMRSAKAKRLDRERYSKGSGTSGKLWVPPETVQFRKGKKYRAARAEFIKRYGSRGSAYRKNTKLTPTAYAQAGGRGKITSKIKRKYHAAKIGWRKNRTGKMAKRNPFSKRSAKKAAKKFWRSVKGRKWKAARRRGLSMKAAWRTVGSGTTSPRKKKRSSPKRKRVSAATRAARRARSRVAKEWGAMKRAHGHGKGRLKRRKNRRRSRRRNAYVVANPRRRRYRRVRRALYSRKNRRGTRRRRNTYLVANKRRRSRGRRRNLPYYGIFTNRRRGRRRNPGRILAFAMPALWALGGLTAARAIPGLVARFAPSVVASIAGVAGAWADVAVSAASLALIVLVGGRLPVVGAYMGRSEFVLGATLSLVMDIAAKVLPAGILSAPTAAPVMAGWSPGERTGAIAGYVNTPMLQGYVKTPMLGAYVEEGGMGADVRAAMMGLGAEVTSGPCPGCTPLQANFKQLPIGAQMRAQGFYGTVGHAVPNARAIAVPGIFRGSIFGR